MTDYKGRGAWTRRGIDNGLNQYGYIKGEPLTGSTGSKETGTKDQVAVHYAVYGIQQTLNRYHGFKLLEDGKYGAKTEVAVTAVQKHAGLTVLDGRVGSKTAAAIFRPLLISVAKNRAAILHGQIIQESSYDPGAVNPTNGIDSGLVQINLDATGVLYEDAFDPEWAVTYSYQRLLAALDNFSSKGPVLQLDCAIAAHNSPRGARQWYASGTAPTAGLAAYVAKIKKNAETF